MGKNYLVYALVTAWDEPPRARHQVSNELAADGHVYFSEKNRFGLPRIAVNQVKENVTVITPYFWLPCKVRYRIPFINNYYNRWLLKSIRKLNVPFDIAVNFDYTAKDFGRYFKNYVFYCADDNVGFGKFNFGFINTYHTATEKEAAANATICAVTSSYMHKKIGSYNPATYEIALGAPAAYNNVIPLPETKKDKPVLGLVGYLDSNLDYTLMNDLLNRFKIIFIGPVNEKNFKLLSHTENAVFTGAKTGKALYESLQQADVCIAPYEVSVLNKGATPNKLWLYLSLGKPSVITSMPNIEHWQFEKDTVYITENDQFEELCQTAYINDTPALQKKRLQLASDNSWSNKVKEMKMLYYRHVKGHQN